MGLGLDNLQILESRWVSVSTTLKNQSLDESRSQQLWKIRVSMSLGLDNFGNQSLGLDNFGNQSLGLNNLKIVVSLSLCVYS